MTDPTNPLASAVRSAIDRRAALTGEPNSEQRDAMAERERAAEKAKDEAVAKMMEALERLAARRGFDRIDNAVYGCTFYMQADEYRAICAAISAARAAGIGTTATPAVETNFHEWPDY